jgi:uncharacterized protein (TIRG00374 family)
MQQNIRRVVYVLLAAIAVYGAYAVWRGLGSMGATLAAFEWWTFAVACALAFGNYVLRFLKWEFYLSRLQIRGVTKIDSFLTFLSGFVLTMTPGKVGEVFKSLVLFETYGVPVPKTAPIVIAERVTDLIGVIVLIVIGSLGFSGGLFWAAAGAIVVSVLLVVIASRTLALKIIGIVERMPGKIGKIGPKLHQAYDSLAILVAPRNLGLPTLLSICAWSLECLALWVILRGFGQHTDVALCFFFYATSTLAGALVPVPGGLGVTEGALEAQMIEIGRVNKNQATAAMFLVRLATLWFAVLVGFIALSLLKRRHPGLLAHGEEIRGDPHAAP